MEMGPAALFPGKCACYMALCLLFDKVWICISIPKGQGLGQAQGQGRTHGGKGRREEETACGDGVRACERDRVCWGRGQGSWS